MNNYEKIYWLTRLDSIQEVLITLTILSGLTFLFYWILYAVDSDFRDDDENIEFKRKYGGKAKLAQWIGLTSLIIVTFLPNKNEMIIILAGGKAMDFIENDPSINKITAQTTKIVSEYLDKMLKDMDKEQK